MVLKLFSGVISYTYTESLPNDDRLTLFTSACVPEILYAEKKHVRVVVLKTETRDCFFSEDYGIISGAQADGRNQIISSFSKDPV
jgi:hypothetical protein